MSRAVVIVMALLTATIATAAQGREPATGKAEAIMLSRAVAAETLTTTTTRHAVLLPGLIAEALENNPEIQAAYQEREAARQRIAPAEALDDPMLEAGVINAPLA